MQVTDRGDSPNAEVGGRERPVGLPLPATFSQIECVQASVRDRTAELSRGEAQVVAKSIIKRRSEYSTGRWLARHLLSRFEVTNYELLPDPDRQPIWPDRLVGSITHSDAIAVVAVANKSLFSSLGIDIEKKDRVSCELIPRLLTSFEQQRYADIDPTLIYSAKEACYKYLFPLLGHYVDYLDVEVVLGPSDSSFALRDVGNSAVGQIVDNALGYVTDIDGHWFCCVGAEQH